MRTRSVLLGATAAIAFAAACGDSTGPGLNRNVALITSTSFAQYDTSNTGSEASELEFTLAYLGATVTPVTTIDSASLATVLGANRVFIISEQGGSGGLYDSLSAGAKTLLRNFVDSSGGTLIVVADGQGLTTLDTLFGYTISAGNSQDAYPLDGAGAAGTPFAGGPDLLWDNNGTYPFDVSTLPAQGVAIYADGTDGAVALVPQGRGNVVIYSWDWYNAMPHGTQDGGWIEMLKRALSF